MSGTNTTTLIFIVVLVVLVIGIFLFFRFADWFIKKPNTKTEKIVKDTVENTEKVVGEITSKIQKKVEREMKEPPTIPPAEIKQEPPPQISPIHPDDAPSIVTTSDQDEDPSSRIRRSNKTRMHEYYEKRWASNKEYLIVSPEEYEETRMKITDEDYKKLIVLKDLFDKPKSQR